MRSRVLVAGLAFVAAARAVVADPPHVYRGVCDASAAVELGKDTFVVAGDEDNSLRLYRFGDERMLARSRDLSPLLDAEGDGEEFREADIEGAARIDGLVFWIGSHGQNKKGKARPTRHLLFATHIAAANGEELQVELEGAPYRKLVDDLVALPALAPFAFREAREIAPKKPGGLNIEGLGATPGGALLIGFRSPLSANGDALILPLLNPLKVIRGESPTFGEPMTLPLGDRGIRSLEYLPSLGAYLVVAGPTDGDGLLAIYEWSGRPGDAPALYAPDRPLPDGFAAEALLVGARAPYVLSDDGGVENAEGVKCKKLPEAEQTFRGLSLRP